MWEQLKGWVAGRIVRETVRPWEEAGRAWRALAARDDWSDHGDRDAVWTVVTGLQSALRAVDESVRHARSAAADPALRRALNETAYALASTLETVEAHIVPHLEKRIGPPPKGESRHG